MYRNDITTELRTDRSTVDYLHVSLDRGRSTHVCPEPVTKAFIPMTQHSYEQLNICNN